MLLREAGNLQEALNHLDTYDSQIVDRCALQETRAAILLQLGDLEKAATIYRDLIHRNPENWAYYECFETAVIPGVTIYLYLEFLLACSHLVLCYPFPNILF